MDRITPSPPIGWRRRAKDGLRRVPALRAAKRGLGFLRAAPDHAGYHASETAQRALIAAWRTAYANGVVLPLGEVGFSRHSEFEEDGVILYLMTLAGTTNRTLVEISSQDGRVCMGTNLVIHHRWRGFLFDGDPIHVREGRKFFAGHRATASDPPVMEARWFTRSNIDAVLQDLGVPEEIDLMSIDIDGVDLHLWAALSAVSPRLLVCEFNNAVPHDVAVTVPYADAFDFRQQAHPMHRSASLAAYVAVCRAKGYRLVGMNALGFNAYFLRDDVLAGTVPEIPASALATNDFAHRMRTQYWSKLSTLPWVAPPDAAAPRLRRHHSLPQSELSRSREPENKTFSAFPSRTTVRGSGVRVHTQ